MFGNPMHLGTTYEAYQTLYSIAKEQVLPYYVWCGRFISADGLAYNRISALLCYWISVLAIEIVIHLWNMY